MEVVHVRLEINKALKREEIARHKTFGGLELCSSLLALSFLLKNLCRKHAIRSQDLSFGDSLQKLNCV